MNPKFESPVDETGMNILHELQTNARSTFSEIGKKIGLSSPAVAERIYKMEEAGLIKGYHADINPEVFCHNITAFITLTTRPEKYKEIYLFAENKKEITECHHVSGSESLIMKVASTSVSHLEKTVEDLSKFGETKSAIVLSTPIKKNILESIE